MTLLSKVHPITWLGGLSFFFIGGLEWRTLYFAVMYIAFMTYVLRDSK